jgi:hypothetical protein
MPQKSNEWDPNQHASPVPQEKDDELEMAEDDEDFEEEEDFDEDEGETAEDVGEE